MSGRSPSGSGSLPPGSAAGSARFQPPPGPLPARRAIGRFEIERELGRGGMGVVYLARDGALGRTVAIKTVVAASIADAEGRERVLREARLCAQLTHPSIVRVHEVALEAATPYIVMEHVDGPTLDDLLREGRLDRASLLRHAHEIALALQAAHEHGVVHRDVKPQNVLVDRASGRAMLTDFGLAREDSMRITATGDVFGTPAYMAPEQARGDRRAQGPATDVWALGVILYRGLVGRSPFERASPLETLHAILSEEPPGLRELDPAIPRELDAVVMRCLRKEPAGRWGSAAELADRLERLRTGEAPPTEDGAPAAARRGRARRLAPLVLGALVLVALGALLPIGLRWRREREAERAAARRRSEIDAVIERAARGELSLAGAERERILAMLTTGDDPEVAERLAREIDAVTERMRDVFGDLLIAAAEPDAHERELGFERIAGLERVLERWLDPERVDLIGDPVTLRLFWRATRRLQSRRARLLGGVAGIDWRRIVADAFEGAIGPRRDAVGLWLDALARIGVGGGVAGAVARYHALELDPARAAEAAVVLIGLGHAELGRHLGAGVQRFGDDGPWAERVLPEAARAGIELPPDPPATRAVTALAIADRTAADDPRAALALLDEAVALAPELPFAWSARGRVRKELGDLGGALADLERAVALDPEDPVALLWRSEVHRALRAFDRALGDADRAVAIAPFLASACRTRAELRAAGGDLDGALADVGRLLQLEPDDPFAFAIRARIHRLKGENDRALEDFESALARSDQIEAAWVGRAELRMERGDLDGAVDDLTRAMERVPRPGTILWVLRADLNVRRGDPAVAVADLEAAAAQAPDNPHVWLNLGKIRVEHLRDYQRAERDLTRALELEPRLSAAWHWRGAARLNRRDYVGAESDQAQALALDPRRPEPWLMRAKAMSFIDHTRALPFYDEALKRDPDWTEPLLERGALRCKLGDLAGGRADFDRVIAIAPHLMDGWFGRATARAGVGDYEGAIADLDRALATGGSDRTLEAIARQRLAQYREALAKQRAEGK